MTDTSFIESEERQALRKAVASWVANYGHEYYLDKARKHEHTSELWAEAGKLGFLGVNLGGNGLTKEYGVAAMMTSARLARIAPISREMVLNFVAQTSLGLPRSY